VSRRSHLGLSGEYDILAPLGAGEEEVVDGEVEIGDEGEEFEEVEIGDEGEEFEQDGEEARWGQRKKSTARSDAD